MRLIDADALHKTAIVEKRRIFKDGKLRTDMVYKEVYRKEEIDNAPTIESATVVHGEWIKMCENPLVNKFKCSVCGTETIKGNYCKECDALMDGKVV